MQGSYKQITAAMKDSNIMWNYPKIANIPKQMKALFQQVTYYYFVLCQYNELKKLSRHDFNSEIPDLNSWSSAEIWGYVFIEGLLKRYRRMHGFISEDTFHDHYWINVLQKTDVRTEIENKLEKELTNGIHNLARYEERFYHDRGRYADKKWLKKRYELHIKLRKVIGQYLRPQLPAVEEAVDAVLSQYSTDVILYYLDGNTDSEAMGLYLFVGLKLTPALSGGRIEDDCRRMRRLFESSCTCSLKKAQAGIEDILTGYAYTDFRSREDLILWWKSWLAQWEEAEDQIRSYAAKLR